MGRRGGHTAADVKQTLHHWCLLFTPSRGKIQLWTSLLVTACYNSQFAKVCIILQKLDRKCSRGKTSLAQRTGEIPPLRLPVQQRIILKHLIKDILGYGEQRNTADKDKFPTGCTWNGKTAFVELMIIRQNTKTLSYYFHSDHSLP